VFVLSEGEKGEEPLRFLSERKSCAFRSSPDRRKKVAPNFHLIEKKRGKKGEKGVLHLTTRSAQRAGAVDG